MKTLGTLFFCLLLGFSAHAGKKEKALEKKYTEAKELFDQKEYQATQAQFKEIYSYDIDENPYKEQAMFFFSLGAFHLKNYKDANFILHKLINEHPKWKNIDHVLYLYLNTALETKDYYKVYTHLPKIKDQSIVNKAEKMVYSYYNELSDEKLWTLHGKYPSDKKLVTLLAEKLGKNYKEKQVSVDRLLYLAQEYDIKLDVISKITTRKAEKKDTFNIAVLLPYFTNTEEYLKQKYYLEIFQGIKMAVEKENDKGKTPYFKLYNYDTEKKPSVIKELLSLDEMKQMDLMVSTIKSNEQLFIDFSKENETHLIDPFLRSDSIMSLENLLYYQQASFSAEGISIANYIHTLQDSGTVLIFYEETNSYNKTTALSCSKQLRLLGDTSIVKTVSSDNVYDMKKAMLNAEDDSIGIKALVVLESGNSLVRSNCISALENGDINAPIIVSKDWLDYDAVEYEQYQRRNFHFSSPGHIFKDKEGFQAFGEKFEENMGVKPMRKYAFWSYDFMSFWIYLLQKYGNIVVNDIKAEAFRPAELTAGYHYKNTHANTFVPLIRLNEEYQFDCVNCPKPKNNETKK